MFASIRNREADIRIPRYDKSAHDGRGDRAEERTWDVVNREDEGDEKKVDVVLFEGWCAGFRALSDGKLEERWKTAIEALERANAAAGARSEKEGVRMTGRLGRQKLADLKTVNKALREYTKVTE